MRIRLMTSLLALSATAGCTEYLDRKETVYFGAGNAVQTNAVTHVIDPQPPRAQLTRLQHHGERMQQAVERYRTNETSRPEPAATTTTATE